MVCYRKSCTLASEQGWLRHCCHIVLGWVSCCNCCWPATWLLGRLRIVSWLCWDGSDFRTASIIAAISLLVRGALLSVCLITVSVVWVVLFAINQEVLFDKRDWVELDCVALLSSLWSHLLLLKLLPEEPLDFLLAFCGIRIFLFSMIRKYNKRLSLLSPLVVHWI